jgi:hypothetical protein
MAQAGFHNVLSTLAWVPGVFLCIEAWVATRSRVWAAALAVAVTMLLLAGFIQYAYYGLVLAAAYLAFRVRASPGRTIAGGLLFFLGAGIAAVQLIPTFELSRESVRHAGLHWDDSTGYSVFPGQLITVLAPAFFGTQPGGDWWGPGAPWEGVLYLGALPFLLAVLALGRGPRPLVFFLGGAALSGLFLATGRYNPLFPFLFESVPGLRLFHAPARFALWYVFRPHADPGMSGAPLPWASLCWTCSSSAGSSRPRRIRGYTRPRRRPSQPCGTRRACIAL